MPYQARRNDIDEDRALKNNTDNIKNAADVAIASGNAYAMAAGAAVKAGDKLTGGKASEALGKGLTKVTEAMPGGAAVQEKLDQINESGLGDKAGKAASIYTQVNSSTPTSLDQAGSNGAVGKNKSNSQSNLRDENSNLDNQDYDGNSSGKGTVIIKKVAIFGLPILISFIFLFTIIIAVVTTYADFEDALGASNASGEETGSFIDFNATTEEAKDFYKRINEVKQEFANQGKTVEAVKIVAVYHIMASENNNYTYRSMTKAKIREIAKSMFKGDEYDVAVFEKNLVNTFFKKEFPLYNDKKRESMAERVIKYIDDYYSFLGDYDTAFTGEEGCSYQINGFYYPTKKGNYYFKSTLEFKNLKVRLMQTGQISGHDFGGVFGKELENENLIPFEDYVMGLAHFRINDSAPEEAIKALLVAARSSSLASAYDNTDKWSSLKKDKSGEWILQTLNNTSSQSFCNPNLGCSTNSVNYGQIYSGQNYTAWQKAALATNSKIRTLARQVMGEVLVNEEGNIIDTSYNSSTVNKFIELANKGYDYKQILLEIYNQNKSSSLSSNGIQKMVCNTASTGPYASWKQYQGPWINVQLGNSGKTIKNIGCAATSVAILIAKSGVPTTINLNPGTFVEKLNANGGFGSGSCLGCINWSAASVVAPTFRYTSSINLSGYSKVQKLSTLRNLLNQGYYVTAEVKGNTGEHWVAIDAIQGDNVIMMDPGSTATNLWNTYPWYNTSRFVYFKVS